MPKKKTTLPKNFRELCQVGDLAALQAIYADTDINATERGGGKYHPLAMRDTPPAFMQWLLDHGADANFRRDAGDSPPLYHQVTAGNAEHAAVLLRNGANANYTNEIRQQHPPLRRHRAAGQTAAGARRKPCRQKQARRNPA